MRVKAAKTAAGRRTRRAARPCVCCGADDPWLAELDRAFGNIEGKVATADVWKLLKLSPYARTMDDQIRLTAVMRLLGWERRLLRFRAGEVRRGFARGDDPRTVYVFICPVTGEVTVAHNPPSEADSFGSTAAI